MRWSARLFVVFALILSVSVSSHARAEWEPDFQPWMQALVRGNLDSVAKNVRVEMDMQVRRMNAPLQYPDPSDPRSAVASPNTLALLRPILGYQFRHNMSVWVGYAYQPILFDTPAMRASRNVHEHRVFTQFSLNDVFGERFELGTRARMEHRVRTHGPGGAGAGGELSHWAHRLRLMERVAVRFKKGSPWYAVMSSETFFHLNETRYPSRLGLDQQRTFAGVGMRISSPGDRIELGYLNQLVRRYTDPHQLNHVVLLSVFVSLATR